MGVNPKELPKFELVQAESSYLRFEKFHEWARPFGLAGFNDLHSVGYHSDAPWFEYSSTFFPRGHTEARCYFVKVEHRGSGTRFSKNTDAETFFSPGLFLLFSKAYLNVLSHLARNRDMRKSTVLMLSFLEKALRDLKNDNNCPTGLSLKVFAFSQKLIEESSYGQSIKYDLGKELEILAGMLGTGHHSKSLRLGDYGFNLIKTSIPFKSTIAQRSRKRVQNRNHSLNEEHNIAHLTNEQVACIGLAFQLAQKKYGKNNYLTFIAAIGGLAITTVSMRISDLLSLERGCLSRSTYSDCDAEPKLRIKLYRPKIDEHQELPIAARLNKVVENLLDIVLEFSKEAHEAFKFYISKFGDDFEAIDELYIPPRLKTKLDSDWVKASEVDSILGATDYVETGCMMAQWVQAALKLHFYVNEFDDVYADENVRTKSRVHMRRLSEIESEMRRNGWEFRKKRDTSVSSDKFISLPTAKSLLHFPRGSTKHFKAFYQQSTNITQAAVKTDDLKGLLLKKFKDPKNYPHWPFTAKDRKVRLDKALLVQLASRQQHSRRIYSDGSWWLPQVVSGITVNTYFNRELGHESGRLFRTLGIVDPDGSSPSINIHATRKHYHTEALLKGISESFLDIMAGRRSGPQSDYYDLRTLRDLLKQSIDTFDPDEDFEVIGPAVSDMPKDISIVDRQVFKYEKGAPKHITEVAGCSDDWSVNPCKLFGDCMRCGSLVWRKGDKERLKNIQFILEENEKMLRLAEEKIANGSDFESIERHKIQFEETIVRCKEIIQIEENDEIAIGTIVTFSSSENATSIPERVVHLRKENALNSGTANG